VRKRLWAEGLALALVVSVVLLLATAWRTQLSDRADLPALDFAHFYTLGFAAAHMPERAALVSDDAWRALIGRLAPGRDQYPRVYGPHVALWFAPFARLRLPIAYMAWNVLTIIGVASTVAWLVSGYARVLRPHHFWLVTATLTFPPLVLTLLLGHAGVVALIGLAVATMGTARDRALVTGGGLALLSFKPTWFLPAVAVVALAGQFRAAGVAVAGAFVLLLATVPVLGLEPLAAYVNAVTCLAQAPDSVAKPVIMASLRTLWTGALPPTPAIWLYGLTAAATILGAAWAWRRVEDPLQRIGLTSMAVVLATPHIYFYDLILIAPALLAAAAWCAAGSRGSRPVAVSALAAYGAVAVALMFEGLVFSLLPTISNAVFAITLMAVWTRPTEQDARSRS
jgi:hypothetical protein